MKKSTFLLSVLLCLLLLSCGNDSVTETITYNVNEPVTIDAKAFRESVKISLVGQPIEKQGKICFHNGYLYISESERGIHIIDNRNPSSPQNVGFIELMGNVDLSVRNEMLYADSYIDLVWFDISNPAQPVSKGRLEGVFESALPSTDNWYMSDYQMCQTAKSEGKIIVGWNVKERTETITHRTGGHGTLDSNYYTSNSSNSGKGANGINGSMSRFGLYNNYLYTVLDDQMNIFDLSGKTPVAVGEKMYAGWRIETIFCYQDNLFLGSPTGMYIYSVANPLQPVRQSFIQHIYGCDPVVVENDLAYVTVRTGNTCAQNTNELIIFDVSNVKAPKPIASYAMKNPKGLSIDNGVLFLCDDGLKIFKDAHQPQTLIANMVKQYKGMDGFDVIAYNNTLMMIADDGLYQYGYSDLNNITQLSKLPIEKKK